ncbi:glycine zipper domain-containing protein [Afifella pfennigii]|uniref:glycine zipper domain-containing protein n=1 Tax=Afifella pfennigii TaxID=209897 RepID=UPI000A05E1AC|nr:hypothetical protein [Afifella pfennigii]
MKIRTIAIAGIAALGITACTQTEQNAATGAGVGGLAGAVIGGVATNSVGGAVVGGAIGAASGAIIGTVASRPGYCYYRDRNGRRYTAECPAGY